MAVKFKIKKFVHANTPEDGKYYARAAATDEVDLLALAETIQSNCSMKKSDVVAVLMELVEAMTDALHDSKRVRINGFGIFKMAVTGTLTDSVSDVTSKTIKGFRVIFTPEYTRDSHGHHVVKMTSGVTAEPYDSYKDGRNDNI